MGALTWLAQESWTMSWWEGKPRIYFVTQKLPEDPETELVVGEAKKLPILYHRNTQNIQMLPEVEARVS